MHIKTVTIQGFKSYSDKTVVGPFHRGHNVVVGRNGSGKSNFFSAIEFVLSAEFSNLRLEQRCSLLHEGSGPRSINAFVEIVFDNTDRRFPVESDEVSIKRSIGAKKDQFYLNSKLASNKSEVIGLLEAAGFSYSNPYYIVKQGQINSIACCSERDRLRVVREVAGTEVYTEKKKGAEEELAATDTIVTQVGDSLRMVADRLEQLGEEKEMLEQFMSMDKRRRAVEFAIVEGDMKEARQKLGDAERELDEYVEESGAMRERFEKANNEFESKRRKLSKCRGQYKILIADLREMEDGLEEITRNKEALELLVEDGENEATQQVDKKAQLEQVKNLLTMLLTEKETTDQKLHLVLGQVKVEKESLALLEQERNQMFARKGRGEQFATKEERDDWIREETKIVDEQLEFKQIQVLELSKELKACQENFVGMEETLETRKTERMELVQQMEKTEISLRQSVVTKAEVTRKLTDMSQATNLLRQTREELVEEERNLEYKLKTIPGLKQALAGHSSIMKVLDNNKRLQDGYYGMVINLFSCPDQMFTAVDETAGMKLFNHVVETDMIATELMAELNRRKLPGVFNFMPLNRIRVNQFDYSIVDGQDAFPVIEKLQYDEDFEGIISFVFGKTLVCRNMDTVVRLARTSKLDCITLDGEKGSSKGVLSGGYVSLDRSKMANYDRHQAAVGKLGVVVTEIEHSEGEMVKLEQEMVFMTEEVEKFQNLLAKNGGSLSKLVADCRLMFESGKDLKTKCLEEEQRLGELTTDKKLMEATLFGLRKELGVEMNSQLSVEEKHVCEVLVKKIEKSKASFKKKIRDKDELEKENSVVESKMVGLRKDTEELSSEISKLGKRDREVEKAKLDLDNVAEQLGKEKERLAAANARENELNEEVKSLQSREERKEKEASELREMLGDESRRKEKLFEKKIYLQKSIQKLGQKVNSLGGVQPEMLERYKNNGRTVLGKELQKINQNQKLKKFDNVNKKALDQFVIFTEENERLVDRLNQLTEDKTRILNMINVLDTKKSDQILYTFKQLYKNFKQMFSRIVPGGRGELVLTGETVGLTDADRMESATGLTTSVSFTGDQAMKNLDQLSGGQKSVVALAFILAIQQCDPAPFYLFDEVDAALDIEHRRAIAAVIHSQAGDAQFITTTFRPEMLRHADQCFGVLFRGKASHVVPVTREEAENFVQESAIQM